MQNQNFFYEPQYPQYDAGIYGRYKYFAIPYRYPSKPMKRYNYCFSSEEENYNSKGFYFLTDKNNSTINQNYLNRLVEEDIYLFQNSQNYQDYNYQPIPMKKMQNNNKIMYKENDSRITNSQYIPLSNREKRGNSNEEKNMYYNSFNNKNSGIKNNKNKKVYILRKNYSRISIGPFNQNNGQENNNINNNQQKYYNQPLVKHNSHRVLCKNYNKVNNAFNNEFNNQKNNYEEKSNCNLNKEIDTKAYCGNKWISISEQSQKFINNLKINTDLPKKCDDFKMNIDKPKNYNDLNQNKTINNLSKNNYHLTKISKSNKNTNTINTGYNKEEYRYKPPLNKNASYSHIESIEGKKFIKKNCENNSKKKINLVINTANTIDNKRKDNYSSNKMGSMNKITKISLVNEPKLNENHFKKNNRSFYEEKSLLKEYQSQKNMKVKNNNVILNVPNDISTELKIKKINEKLTKVNTNNIAIGDNYITEKTDLSKRKINSSELNTYVKKEGKLYLQKGIYKKTFENNNKYEIKNIDNISNKENINSTNSIPKRNGEKTDNTKKIMIKIDKVQFNNCQGNIINKKITTINGNKTNNYNEYIIDLKAKKMNTLRPSGSYLYKGNYKPIKINKIMKSNVFSYFPKKNESRNNLDKKNLIQLLNINHKAYEEDFPLNAKKNINYLNKTLKSQIAFRIVLFATKKPENKKYYLVNKFYSENIRDKPKELESDF